MRQSEFQRELDVDTLSLSLYPATGRLWAVWLSSSIQILRWYIMRYYLSLSCWPYKKCLNQEKSGAKERLKMKPLTPRYNMEKAEEFLYYAIKLRPKYGDSSSNYWDCIYSFTRSEDSRDSVSIQTLTPTMEWCWNCTRYMEEIEEVTNWRVEFDERNL